MRISDWSSDVCSSDLLALGGQHDDRQVTEGRLAANPLQHLETAVRRQHHIEHQDVGRLMQQAVDGGVAIERGSDLPALAAEHEGQRSEERRVGKECVSTCSSRWSPYPSKKKQQARQKT